MNITLTLNDLEKLCGGPEPAHVIVRQQIAVEFAKRYLKPILNDDVWKKTVDQVTAAYAPKLQQVQAYCDTKMAEAVGRDSKDASGRMVFTLNDTCVKLIRDEVRRTVDEFISEEIKLQMAERTRVLTQAAKWQIAEQVQAGYGQFVQEEIRARMSAMADAFVPTPPMPWCNACRAYHATPIDVAHHALMGCKADCVAPACVAAVPAPALMLLTDGDTVTASAAELNTPASPALREKTDEIPF